MTQLNSDFYCFPFFFFAPSFVEKKSVFERVFLFVPTTRACPLLLLFCARATGQLSNVCYLCWRSLVIKTGLVVVLLLCSASSVNSIQIQTFSMKKKKLVVIHSIFVTLIWFAICSLWHQHPKSSFSIFCATTTHIINPQLGKTRALIFQRLALSI